MCRITFRELTFATALYLNLIAGCWSELRYEERKYILEGHTFNITCERSLYGAPKWTKDGSPLNPGEDNHYIMDEGERKGNVYIMRLHVNSAKLTDRGRYKCDAVNSRSHRIEVIPTEDTNSKKRPNTVSLRRNEALKLNCPEVSEINNASWYKDNQRIIATNRIVISGPMMRTLTVENATEEDAGDYLCTTDGSTLTYPVRPGYVIPVTYEPRIEEFQSQIRPIKDRNFLLECKVHGYPVPRITWFIDGVPADVFVQNHSRMSIKDKAQGLPGSLLFIQNITRDDNHVVKCTAKNFQGSSETSVELAVMDNMISTNEVDPGQGMILTPGSDLVLHCNTTDDLNMKIEWLKNGNPVDPTTDDRIDMKINNTLKIVRTTEGDTGNYTCVTVEGNVNATIVVRTEIKLLPFDHSRNIVEGQNIVLVCNVTQGIPLPTLEWFKDAEALNLSDPRISTEADRGIEAVKLTINEAVFEDRAKYMCVATNYLGSVNETILVRVKDKYAALWPFLGICVEVAVLCTIIFIYEKKRQKPDFDESEADHNTENKTVSDQEDRSQDVRQRK